MEAQDRQVVSRAAAALALLLVLPLLGEPATAQSKKGKRRACPYCLEKPELMKAAGIVSHGPFPFASKTTEEIDAHLSDTEFIWLEGEHLKLGTNLEPYTLPDRERKKVRAELEELAKLLPRVKPRTRVLDPHLRAHLFLWRAEQHYASFQKLLAVTDASFPGQRPDNYMGEGLYLGEKGKYELMLHQKMKTHLDFLRHFIGVVQARSKWHNFPELDNLLYSCAATGSPDLDGRDTQVHNAAVHGMSHCFLNGYRHYSYDLPRWFEEGLAHWSTWENFPGYPQYCLGEGTTEIRLRSSKWRVAVRKLVVSSDDVNLTRLMTYRAYEDFREAHHLSAFSKVDFMIRGFEDDGERFRKFVNIIKGRLRPDGYPDGQNIYGVFRRAFVEVYGTALTGFDEKWRGWVRETYPAR